MARILICEPHADVRSLLAVVVGRIGHEAVLSDGTREQALGVQAVVVEPGDEASREVAAWARAHVPGVAIVCASIFPPGPECAGLAPDAYLVKPFPLLSLEEELVAALARRAA